MPRGIYGIYRGITIKAHPVTMLYQARNGETYELNLIDTPGHVDFSYEVSRSLGACEGALLIIDAAQGLEAQTVANVHLAMKQNLTIIPIINKIDLPNANVPQTKQQLEDILAIPGDSAITASAKEGIGIDEILEAIVERVPAPKPTGAVSLQALVFDSFFDTYKGLYCVGCERIYTERELVDGKCPDHDREPIERDEANYFFRMSKYQQWLIQHIKQYPDFIRAGKIPQ